MTSGRCPGCGSPLHELAGIAPRALGCDACEGFWLDDAALSSIAPRKSPAVDVPAQMRSASAGGSRACPACGSELASMDVAATTTVSLERCTAHGIWFDACDLAAVRNVELARRIARALVADNALLDAGERAAALAAFDTMQSRSFGFVRPAGNPAMVSLGTGNSVFLGGVVVITASGRDALASPTSPWIWPGILSVTGALVLIMIAFGVWDAPLFLGVALESFLCLLFAVLAAGTYFVARRHRMKSLEIDGVRRAIRHLDGGRVVLAIPARLMRTVRIQLYADPGYIDKYDILVTLGFAELWVMQTSGETHAKEIATTVASALGVRLDPELQRKGG